MPIEADPTGKARDDCTYRRTNPGIHRERERLTVGVKSMNPVPIFAKNSRKVYLLKNKLALVTWACALRSAIVSPLLSFKYFAIYNFKINLPNSLHASAWRMAKELNEAVRGQIVALSNEGFSQRQIAAKIGVSKGAVQRTVERFRKTKSYSNLPRSGRPRCTTSQEDRFIKITSLRNRTATTGNIQSSINATREKTICKTTVRRRLAASSLKRRVAVSKPLLLLWNTYSIN